MQPQSRYLFPERVTCEDIFGKIAANYHCKSLGYVCKNDGQGEESVCEGTKLVALDGWMIGGRRGHGLINRGYNSPEALFFRLGLF